MAFRAGIPRCTHGRLGRGGGWHAQAVGVGWMALGPGSFPDHSALVLLGVSGGCLVFGARTQGLLESAFPCFSLRHWWEWGVQG